MEANTRLTHTKWIYRLTRIMAYIFLCLLGIFLALTCILLIAIAFRDGNIAEVVGVFILSVSILAVVAFLPLSFLAVFYPEVELTEDGFRLKILIGWTTKTFRWDEISAIERASDHPPWNIIGRGEKLHLVLSESLGLLWAMTQANYQLDNPAFIVSEEADGFTEFMQHLRANRPDLLDTKPSNEREGRDWI